MKQLFAPFLFLICGWILGFLQFIRELIHAHFIRKKIKIEKGNAPPVATVAAPPTIEASPSDPDMSSNPILATRSNLRVKSKIPVNKTNLPVSTAAPPAIESPPSDYDISSPVVVKKSNPPVITPTPVISQAPLNESPLVVIDISNDPETDSHNEEMVVKTVVTIADAHQQPKEEKVNGTKSKNTQPKPVTTKEPLTVLDVTVAEMSSKDPDATSTPYEVK